MTYSNDAAFPRPFSLDTSGDYPTCVSDEYGLTKREYFAAMAMQGMLSAEGWSLSEESRRELTEHAVNYANALITALNPLPVHTVNAEEDSNDEQY